MSDERMPIEDQRIAMEVFIEDTLRMMVLCGALANAAEPEPRQWCVQFPGGDPQVLSHDQTMLLAYGFRSGITHYHAYKKEMRAIQEIIAAEE